LIELIYDKLEQLKLNTDGYNDKKDSQKNNSIKSIEQEIINLEANLNELSNKIKVLQEFRNNSFQELYSGASKFFDNMGHEMLRTKFEGTKDLNDKIEKLENELMQLYNPFFTMLGEIHQLESSLSYQTLRLEQLENDRLMLEGTIDLLNKKKLAVEANNEQKKLELEKEAQEMKIKLEKERQEFNLMQKNKLLQLEEEQKVNRENFQNRMKALGENLSSTR